MKLVRDLIVWHGQLGVGKVRSIQEDGNVWCTFLFYSPDVLVEPKYLAVVKPNPNHVRAVQHAVGERWPREQVEEQQDPIKDDLFCDKGGRLPMGNLGAAVLPPEHIVDLGRGER